MTAQAQAKTKVPSAATFGAGHATVLQRKCACGGAPGLSGECDECQNTRLQRKVGSSIEPGEIPPIVHEVLRSPGEPKSANAGRLLANLKKMSAATAALSFECSGSEGCGGRNAEFDPASGKINFCPPFFQETDVNGRASTLIHELAHGHATTGGPRPVRAKDLALLGQRAYSLLSVDEALNNADSYANFIRELGAGRIQQPRQALDTLSQCRTPPFPVNVVEITRKALALAERWNVDAMETLTDTSQPARTWLSEIRGRYFTTPHPTLEEMLSLVFARANAGFAANLRFECATDCEQSAVAYYKTTFFIFTGNTLYLCPSWFSQLEEPSRAESMYRLILQRYAGVPERDAGKFVAFTRELSHAGSAATTTRNAAPPPLKPDATPEETQERLKQELKNTL